MSTKGETLLVLEMKIMLLLGLLFAMLLPEVSHAQAYQAKGDFAFDSAKHIFHLVGDDLPLQNEDIDDIAAPKQAPIVPASSHPTEVAASERAYESGKYAEAAAVLAKAANLDSVDPTVLYHYARALYRNPSTKHLSYSAYKRLIGLLDKYGREDQHTVAVYLLFWEAYFKLATLQLDMAQWAAASYNLSRAATALQSLREVRDANEHLREQILQFQTEYFAHLNNPTMCRYFGQRTLRLFPGNRYVQPYLATLPKPKATHHR
jgi:tetratricopeptide (TPR) repeat protein